MPQNAETRRAECYNLAVRQVQQWRADLARAEACRDRRARKFGRKRLVEWTCEARRHQPEPPKGTLEYRLAKLRERLDRAEALKVRQVGRTLYHVRGGDDPDGHFVNIAKGSENRCLCGDRVWRESVCKHRLAVALHRARGLRAERRAYVERTVIGSRAFQAVAHA